MYHVFNNVSMGEATISVTKGADKMAFCECEGKMRQIGYNSECTASLFCAEPAFEGQSADGTPIAGSARYLRAKCTFKVCKASCFPSAQGSTTGVCTISAPTTDCAPVFTITCKTGAGMAIENVDGELIAKVLTSLAIPAPCEVKVGPDVDVAVVLLSLMLAQFAVDAYAN